MGASVGHLPLEANGVPRPPRVLSPKEPVLHRGVARLWSGTQGPYRCGILLGEPPRPFRGGMREEMRKRVLLVDDDRLILEMLTFGLQRMDMEIRTAANGVEALQIAWDFQPDIIIMDILRDEFKSPYIIPLGTE